jgi:hypothetical protein
MKFSLHPKKDDAMQQKRHMKSAKNLHIHSDATFSLLGHGARVDWVLLLCTAFLALVGMTVHALSSYEHIVSGEALTPQQIDTQDIERVPESQLERTLEEINRRADRHDALVSDTVESVNTLLETSAPDMLRPTEGTL